MAHDPRYDASVRVRAARLYRSGKTVRQIAQALRVSVGRAYILALQGGAQMRPRGRRPKPKY